VAVKENINDNSSWDDSLTNEMQLFLDLHHPHVVACYGILKEARTTSTDERPSGGGAPAYRKRRASTVRIGLARGGLDHWMKFEFQMHEI
jgi:hypothetical protein